MGWTFKSWLSAVVGDSRSARSGSPDVSISSTPTVKQESEDWDPFRDAASPLSASARRGAFVQPESTGAFPPPSPSPSRRHTSAPRTLPNRQTDEDFIKAASRDQRAYLASNPPLSPPSTPVKPRSTRAGGSRALKGPPSVKSEDDASASSNRAVKVDCVAQDGLAPGLLTPPPSTRKAPRRGRHPAGKDENKEDGEPDTASPLTTKLAPSYQLPTPDPSPVKTMSPSPATPTKPSRKTRKAAGLPLPAKKIPSSPAAVFLDWTPAEHGIVDSEYVQAELPDGTPFVTLKAKNGDLLKFYQAMDVKDIVNETLTRDDMARDNDPNLREIPQGRILGYQAGLGKTHVATMAIIEHAAALKSKYKQAGVEFNGKPVLIICDKTLQQQWIDKVLSLSGGEWEVAIYDKGRQSLPRAQVIIASVAMLRFMYDRWLAYWENKEELYESGAIADKPDLMSPTPADLAQLRSDAPFFVTQFRYLIIDEFHTCIANPSTTNARAILTLTVDHYLLLSGTPAQNKLDDFQVAVALLQHRSKRLDFKIAEAIYRRNTREMKSDKTAPKLMKAKEVVHFHAITPALVLQIMITRRNESGQADKPPLIELPERTDFVVSLTLNGKEAVLEQLMSTIQECALVKILRRRQACLHPMLLIGAILKMYGLDNPDEDLLKELEKTGEDVTEQFGSLTESRALVLSNPSRRAREKAAEFDLVLDSLGVKECFRDDYLSLKFKVARGILTKTRRERRDEKTIIFSMFASLLERFSKVLDDHKIKHALFTGKKNRNQREQALQDIACDPHCSVMLVSMKAGGTGLNITACNNVIILDPWWNPYVEEQAISRVYRMGQARAVHVYRILAPNTIEKKIIGIQESKRSVIDGFTEVCATSTLGSDIARKRDPRYLV